MSNIVQLYRSIGERLPLVVHRNTWSDDFGLVITHIRLQGPPKNYKSPEAIARWFGSVKYGLAVGYGLPPLDGRPANDYWGLPNAPKVISCAGCYQWRLAEHIPDVWQEVIDHAATLESDPDAIIEAFLSGEHASSKLTPD